MSNGFTEQSGAQQGDGGHGTDADQAASISAAQAICGSGDSEASWHGGANAPPPAASP